MKKPTHFSHQAATHTRTRALMKGLKFASTPNLRKRKRTKRRVARQGGAPISEHNEFTQFPFIPLCQVCLSAKMQKAPHGACDLDNRRCDALPGAVRFGDRLTAEHATLNEDNKSAEDENIVACVIQDGFTDWLRAYPCKTKNAADTSKCFQKFLGPNLKAHHVSTYNSKDLQRHWMTCA